MPSSEARDESRLAICSLGGGIERGEGLVEDDHVRLRGERARDGDPLPLSTAELMWETLRGLRWKADAFEKLVHPSLTFGARDVSDRLESVGDLGSDASSRVERRERVLEDQLQFDVFFRALPPGHRPHFPPAEDD